MSNRSKHSKHKKQMNVAESLIYGINTISLLLNKYPNRVKILYIDADKYHKGNPKLNSLSNLATHHNIPINYVTATDFHKWFGEVNHQAIAAEVQENIEMSEKDLLQLVTDKITNGAKPFLLILDRIQDPHNLGACIRTAVAMGVDAVITSKKHSCEINATVKKVACGAASIVSIVRATNLTRLIKSLKQEGIWVVGLDAHQQKIIAQLDLQQAIAIAMGSESEGLKDIIKKECDYLAAIPMNLQAGIDSLNVSVATGICLYEAAKQRS